MSVEDFNPHILEPSVLPVAELVPAPYDGVERRQAVAPSVGGLVLPFPDRRAAAISVPDAGSEVSTTDIAPLHPGRGIVTERLRTPALRAEIDAIQQEGYDISVGNTSDEAYERPDKIGKVYDKLDTLGARFKAFKSTLSAPRTGRLALGLPLPGRAARKQERRMYEGALEDARTTLLYGPVGGQAWHDQRGCATALLTITGAHELAIDGEPGHPTMSAMLDASVMDYTFPRGGTLSGLSLRDAMIRTGQQYRGKSYDASARFADGQLAKLKTFLETPATEDFRDIVEYCTDSLGIRSRREEVASEINRYIDARRENDPDFDSVTMMSIGCGTALPILEVAAGLKDKGVDPKLILLDQDPIALASAAQLAQKLGMEDNIEIHCERLFNRMGKPLDIDKVLAGRTLDVAEDSGLREYLPDRIYVALTRQIWNSLGDNSLMTTGNMNANRPQPEFLHGLMGWAPRVQMRNIKEGIDLHHKSGVPPEALRMRVTQDGVYTLYFSTKSPQNKTV